MAAGPTWARRPATSRRRCGDPGTGSGTRAGTLSVSKKPASLPRPPPPRRQVPCSQALAAEARAGGRSLKRLRRAGRQPPVCTASGRPGPPPSTVDPRRTRKLTCCRSTRTLVSRESARGPVRTAHIPFAATARSAEPPGRAAGFPSAGRRGRRNGIGSIGICAEDQVAYTEVLNGASRSSTWRTTRRHGAFPASPSSRGLGSSPFKAETRVRIPLGTPTFPSPVRRSPETPPTGRHAGHVRA